MSVIVAAFKKYDIGERETTILHGDAGAINQPMIIKREATKQEYIDYWKDHPDYIEIEKTIFVNRIVAYYEVLTD